jgi:hypothetical protein
VPLKVDTLVVTMMLYYHENDFCFMHCNSKRLFHVPTYNHSWRMALALRATAFDCFLEMARKPRSMPDKQARSVHISRNKGLACARQHSSTGDPVHGTATRKVINMNTASELHIHFKVVSTVCPVMSLRIRGLQVTRHVNEVLRSHQSTPHP